jgi:type I restriction enzyme, R subunit
VQRLGSAGLDKDASVVIATIQRVYSLFTGRELSEEDEEKSGFETGESEPQRIARYNAAIPIESFGLIITDECHRSIYGSWRQVLEYFDAFIVGLTATPSLHTMGFFGSNLVAQYPYKRSVTDGVNVPYEIFRIRTDVGEHGGGPFWRKATYCSTERIALNWSAKLRSTVDNRDDALLHPIWFGCE